MTKNLLLDKTRVDGHGGQFTSEEILRQPDLWLRVLDLVISRQAEIIRFLREANRSSSLSVILTGAGTSAFIGDIVEGPFQRATGLCTKAVATTDLVTHPDMHFRRDMDVLLVSFARSGDSPESAKAVQLAQQLSHRVMNLVITCNGNGKLVDAVMGTPHLVCVLPPESDDRSLAMTSSFTSMLLTGLLISDIDNVVKKGEGISLLSTYARRIFSTYLESLKLVADLDFDRAVFLGSGMMRGVARESHLKLQELTDGKIICKYDSFLGFRHGPKVVINEKTLITYLFANSNYVNKYEIDLVKAIDQGRKPIYSIGVMEDKIEGANFDLEIILGDGKSKLSEELLAIVAVLPAQILGFLKSAQLGLKPDNPSESGMIHRVVQGVNVYPYEKG